MRTNRSAPRGQSWRSHYPGRNTNPNNRQSTRHKSTIQETPSPPLGPLIQTLSEVDLLAAHQAQSNGGEPAEITNCTYFTSFNWLDRDEPIILIPGAPPAWTPLDEPRLLDQDRGDYFRDPNAARFPSYPLEPAVRALLTEEEGLETQQIDLFACSSTMGSLLRFVRRVDKPFRFFVEVVKNTVFFVRHENSPTQLIVGVKGYGYTFPEAYTTWDADAKGSASHQRLLRYSFAGLECILRYECDGYLRSRVPEGSDATATASARQVGDEGDNLASNLNRMTKSGHKIPQEAVFDLKTRAEWRKDLNVLEDELPRYWVAQIPNLILARHDGGVFRDITVEYIWDDVQKWQREHQRDIVCLGWLLHKIISVAKAREDKKIEVCCKGLDALELRGQDTDAHDVLPLELKLRWMEDISSEGERRESDEISREEEVFSASIPDTGDGEISFRFDSDEESEKDYTACSAEDCGYCGHCSY